MSDAPRDPIAGRGPMEPRRTFSLPSSPARIDAELDEEFRFHMEERRDELIAGGMSSEAADAEVRRRFGDAQAWRERTRAIDEAALGEQRRARFLSVLRQESRRAGRVLWRDRGFSLIALVTLALGIGATTAMFAVLDAVVLRPLPYAEPERLVAIRHPATVPGSGERHWGLSPGGYVHFGRETRALESFGIYANYGMTVTGGGEAALARVGLVTHTVFDVLRARAALGRLIGPDDDRPGAPRVTVLSHEFHQRRFGGDPTAVGRMLETSEGSFEIVGVTQPGLVLPLNGPFADAGDLAGLAVDLWLAQRIDPAGPFWNNHPHVGIGRLRPGTPIETAQAEFAALLPRFPELMPNAYSARFLENYRFRVEVSPLRTAVLGPTMPRALWMLFGSVLLVLAIAAANVGNLFLVRMESRRRETAVRAALGAEQAHQAAHFLAESLLLCGAATLGGIALAAGALRVVLALAPTDVPRLAGASLGGSALALAAGTGLALALALGLMPLLRRGVDLASLRDGSRGLSASPRQRLVRGALVVGQIALTLMLLASAGLLLRSFDALRRVEPGYDARGTLAFAVSLPFTAYDTREKAAVFHRALQERLRALPGVQAVGAGPAPVKDFGTGCSIIFRENRPFVSGEQPPCIPSMTVLPGWFDALRITVEGRSSTWADVEGGAHAVVVTRALADRLWPGEDPIGKGVGVNGSDARDWYRVVGIVPALRAEALDRPPTEAVFYPADGLQPNQRSGALNDVSYFVRAEGSDPMALVGAVREAVRALDPRVPVVSPEPLTAVVARSTARLTFSLALLGIAGVLGLVLSAVGLYGVVSYVVQLRRSEIGIRLALGSSIGAVLRLVVLDSARLAVLGVAIGIAGAFAVNRTLQAMLYQVRAADPVVMVGVALLLLGIVGLASWGPARRAARIEPVEAMRVG